MWVLTHWEQSGETAEWSGALDVHIYAELRDLSVALKIFLAILKQTDLLVYI